MKSGIERLQDKLIERSNPKKKKVSTLDIYFIMCVVVIISYTIVGIIFQAITNQELSTSLTVGVYGFFGGEITLLAAIKKWKLKGESHERFDV